MKYRHPVSSIWLEDYFDVTRCQRDLQESICKGIHRFQRAPYDIDGVGEAFDGAGGAAGNRKVTAFFRADDIGVPSRNFSLLISFFSKYDIPLGLAMVPTWMTHSRWEHFYSMPEIHLKEALWCWHHHGWRHMNHELTGKKQEFGPSRSEKELMHDLGRGKERLESILGKDFTQIFTPPWNRCSGDCMKGLMSLGYQGISRFENARPEAPEGLKDLSVNVDLHTLKASDPAIEWQMLMKQLEQAIGSGRCGIMIHHQRMNDNAFTFLELLFQLFLERRDAVSILSMDDLI